MDVERTMEFILQQQAKAESQMVAMQTQMGAMQTQMAAMQKESAAIRKESAAIQKRTAAIQKLVQVGMRMIVKQGENIDKLTAGHKQVTGELKELAKAQRTTESKLQAFIDSMRRGGNGRHSRN